MKVDGKQKTMKKNGYNEHFADSAYGIRLRHLETMTTSSSSTHRINLKKNAFSIASVSDTRCSSQVS